MAAPPPPQPPQPPQPNGPPGTGRMAYYRRQNPGESALEVILSGSIAEAVPAILPLLNQYDINSLRTASPRWMGWLPNVPLTQQGPTCDEHLWGGAGGADDLGPCQTNALSLVAMRRCDNDMNAGHDHQGNHLVCQSCKHHNGHVRAFELHVIKRYSNLLRVCNPCKDVVLRQAPFPGQNISHCTCQTRIDARTLRWGCHDCCWDPIRDLWLEGLDRKEDLFYTRKARAAVTMDRNRNPRRRTPACVRCAGRGTSRQEMVLMCVMCRGLDVYHGRRPY